MKMTFLKWSNAFVMTALALTVMSCNNDDDDMPQASSKTITQTVVDDASFSILEAAVVKAGLADALAGGNLTVFAPNNAAFQALQAPFNSAEAITAITDQTQITTLRGILQYHVLGTRVASSALQATQTVATLETDSLTVSKVGANVFVNGSGAKVVTPDVAASNGVVHIIDKVLMPPTGTIAEIASGSDDFNLLVAAVTKAGLATALSSGRYTVFAPTDVAFLAGLRALGLAEESTTEAQAIGVIEGLQPGETLTLLGDILRYHVVPARAFSVDLTNNQSVPTLLAQKNLTVILASNAVTIQDLNTVSTNATVNPADIIATNGVIHVVDQVLIPQ